MNSDAAIDRPSAPRPRIEAIDLARGLALVAMATYHFAWDLEFFGYVSQGLTSVGGWKIFARSIASSFLFLVGVSLFLAHGRGIRWSGYLRRLAMVAGAALAISLVTYVAVPNGFIFFGILHQIALASVLGLAFLRLPAPLTLLVAAGMIAAPYFLRSPIFDHAALWWVGLSTVNPRSNDYVPLFPWFGAVLVGIAVARLSEAVGVTTRLARLALPKLARLPAAAGRHSLAFYLIHQPLLIGCVWLYAQAFPAPREAPEVGFRSSCEANCQQSRDSEFCARYCGCMLDQLGASGDLAKIFAGDGSDDLRGRDRRDGGGLQRRFRGAAGNV